MHGTGTLVTSVLAVEAIPLGILISALLDSSLRRRSRFVLRLTVYAVIQTGPAAVLIVGDAFGLLGEDAVGELLMLCVFWVFVSLTLLPLLLFHGPDRGRPSGESDDEDHGPGPGGEGPPAPRPSGGLPLPDAQPSSVRARGPLPLRGARRARRPAREPDRTPSRLLFALRRTGLGAPAAG